MDLALEQETLITSNEVAALLGHARNLRGCDPETALETASRALGFVRSSKACFELAESLYLCAELQHDLSNYEGSCHLAKEALEHYEVLQHPSGLIDSHDLLGKIYEKCGQIQTASIHHQHALDLSHLHHDERRVGKSLLSLGILRYNQSDYSEAISYYLRALEKAQMIKDDYAQGRILGCLGNAFERMGDYAKSLEYHQQCLHRFHIESYPRERSFALNNIGNVYIALGDYTQAIPCHEQSLALKQQLKDRWGEGSSLQNLGVCYLYLGNLELAECYFRDSLPIVEGINDREGISIAWQGLGDIASQRGQFAEAISYYQPSLALSTELGDRYNQVQTLLNVGKVYKQQTRFEESYQALKDALCLTKDIGAKRLAQQTHNELASLYELQGDLPAALQHLKAAYHLERAVFSEDLEGKLKSLTFHFELERAEKEKELYRLKHVELARAYDELQRSSQELALANTQKAKLLETLGKQKRQLEWQSNHDALTGLYNRRHFDRELSRAFREAKRYEQALSVVICDIDNFKKINDRFSHQIGDEVLKAVAKLFKKHIRTTDVVARYGGEEFSLLLTQTSGSDALRVCEKIRHLIELHPWQKIHPELRVTLSMGISDDMSPTVHDLVLSQADQRLYQAKHNGKNQVVL